MFLGFDNLPPGMARKRHPAPIPNAYPINGLHGVRDLSS